VISIGNLCWGGSGKTPLTAAVTAHLGRRGDAVAILSRGYRSRGDGVRVVSAGRPGHPEASPRLAPEEAGDEPFLLALQLPEASVVVCPDRAAAGRHAVDRLEAPPDLFVLDDGFSHVRLARDLDLLAVPVDDPFGGGRLAPSGRLREPLASSADADAVLLTGPPDRLATGDGAALADALEPFGFQGVGFTAPIRPLPAHTADGATLAAGTGVVLVSGVARPAGVRRAAEALRLDVLDELRFADHHTYPESSRRRIARAVRATGAAAVVTTAKDLVKLIKLGAHQDRLPAPLAEIPIACEPEPAFFEWLDRRLAELRAGRSGKRTGASAGAGEEGA
jgi:tetraacyldisaccharide 4'-kinase